MVELLVVIGIIALLISILLPTLGKARQQANLLKCQSNLRSIGQMIMIYANDMQGYLPIGTFDGVADYNTSSPRSPKGFDYTTLLTWHMNNKLGITWGEQLTTSSLGPRGVFRDVDTVDTSGQTFIGAGTGTQSEFCHYSAHPRIMGNIEEWSGDGNYMPPYKLFSIPKPADLVCVFDGVQILTYGNNASVEPYQLNNYDLFTQDTTNSEPHPRSACRLDQALKYGLNLNACVDGGTNKDASAYNGNAGNIRWRHMNNTAANFLFCDGHVEARHYKSEFQNDLLCKNIWVMSQKDTPPPAAQLPRAWGINYN